MVWLKGRAQAREMDEEGGGLQHLWLESGAEQGMKKGLAAGKVCRMEFQEGRAGQAPGDAGLGLMNCFFFLKVLVMSRRAGNGT